MGRLHQNNGQDEHGLAVVYQPIKLKEFTRLASNFNFLKAGVLVEPRGIEPLTSTMPL
jgi:hypothetical protein